MSKKTNCPGVCSACATINAENERLRQLVARLRGIERSHHELKQTHHDMVYGGYVHPSYWTDGPKKRRQWAQQGLEDDGHAVCVAAAKEAM